MSFEAKYNGGCAACPDRIEPGDQVDYNVDGSLVHADCDEPDLDAPRRNETRCGDCFTLHAGECL